MSPLLTGGTDGVDVSFYYQAHSGTYPDHFQVGYTTDPEITDPSLFTYGDKIISSAAWTLYENTFPAGTVRIAIKYDTDNFDDGWYLYLDDFFFEAHSSNPLAKNVKVEATHTTASISWEGISDSYKVKYRTPASAEKYFYDDFEDGLDQWTIYTEGEARQANGWYTIDPSSGSMGTAYSGNYVASAWSWSNVAYNADNWLVTPQVELKGTLRFYVRTLGAYPDHYEVLLSTTGNNIADFTVTLQAMATPPKDNQWHEVSIDLSSYGGANGYIAIHHKDYDANYLFVDEFGIYGAEIPAGEWQQVATAEKTAELTGLEMDTEYEFTVIGIKDDVENAGTALKTFKTLSDNDKVFSADGNWNEGANWSPAGVPTADNIVYINADATIPSGVIATAKRITIYDGGSITIKDGGELKTGNAVEVTLEKDIAGYGTGEGKFKFITTPTNTAIASTEVEGLLEGDYDYYRFQRTLNLEWRGYAGTPFDLSPANGALYANKEDKTLKFTGPTWASADNYLTMSATYNSSYPLSMILAGNPFTCTGTIYFVNGSSEMTGTIYKLNAAGDGFDKYQGYASVAPGEAVLVEYGESGTIYFESENYGNGPSLGTADNIVLPQHGTVNPDAGPVVEFANSSDNTDVFTAYNGKSVIAKLAGRTLYKDGSWNTLSLPFNLTIAGSPLEGATVKVLNNTVTTFADNTLTVSFEDAPATIPAGTPFIVKWDSGDAIVDPMFTYTTINNADASVAFTGGSFDGNYSPVVLSANDMTKYYMGAANKLYWPSADVTLNSFRAYFNLPTAANAPQILLDFGDGEVTAISAINGTKAATNGSWYTLDGRKLDKQPTTKGVFINNGTKVVIK